MEIDEALQYFSLGLKYRKFKRPIPSYSSTQALAIARDGENCAESIAYERICVAWSGRVVQWYQVRQLF